MNISTPAVVVIIFVSRPAPTLVTVQLKVNIWTLELSQDGILLQIRANVQIPRSLYVYIYIYIYFFFFLSLGAIAPL